MLQRTMILKVPIFRWLCSNYFWASAALQFQVTLLVVRWLVLQHQFLLVGYRVNVTVMQLPASHFMAA